LKEPETMRELHRIRAEHYKKTKNMSFNEFIMDIRKDAQKALMTIREMRKKNYLKSE